MKRYELIGTVLAAALAAGGAGCGDNSKACGPGTLDEDGTCTAQCGPGTTLDADTGTCLPDGSMICGDGTMFDTASGSCVPDPNDCGNGTVLIGGKCVDPTQGLTVDVEEGQEPNGVAFEANATAPAGIVNLKDVGAGTVVIHGHITPFQDLDGDGQFDADIDTYVVTVNKPTLLHVSADGVNGISGGFLAINAGDATDPLVVSQWQRFGVNLTGDTAKRQLFLPEAGTYLLAIADSRTFFLTGAAPGDATTEYFVSVDQLADPTATPLTADANGLIAHTDSLAPEETKFFSVPMGLGFNFAQVTSPTTNSQISTAMVLSNNNALKTDLETAPLQAVVGGIKAGDTTVIAVDNVFNYAAMPVDFELDVETTNAVPLGDAATTAPTIDADGNIVLDISTVPAYFFDVAADGELDGFDLHWNHPVDAVVFDENFNAVVGFTGFNSHGCGFQCDANDPSTTTFSDYKGLIRFPTKGRYYFIAWDPNNLDGGVSLQATTAVHQALTPTTLTFGTPSADTAINEFNSLPFNYAADAATNPWEVLSTAGSGGTGAVTLNAFNPNTTFGRLDDLDTVEGDTLDSDAIPLFSGTGDVPRIVAFDASTTYLLTVKTANETGTVVVDAEAQDFHNYGKIDFDTQDATQTNQQIAAGAANTNHLNYFFTNDVGGIVTLTVHPVGATAATENLQIQLLGANENVIQTVNAKGAGQDEVVTFSPASGITAFRVSSAAVSAVAENFNVVVKVDAPFYTIHNGATAFTDICDGTNEVTLFDSDDGFGDPTDEGISDPLDAPTGFTFYGAAAPQFVVSSNGFLSFDPTTRLASLANAPLPDGSGETSVAADWEDLANIVVCQKTTGTKTIVQWTGEEFSFFGGGAPVQFQAILNAADGSIEIVWSPNQVADGSAATAGVQDLTGTQATQIGFDSAFIVPNTSKLLTHP